MDRRDFLKALGLLASMPMMSKLKFLNKEPVKEGIAAVADKGFAEIDVDVDEVTKGKKAEQLIESEEVYRTTPSGDDYYKDVEEGIMGGTENLEEFLGRKKKKDGGIMELTIMQIPDIEVKGVESLFKAR
jgi:hypothetical protein